MTVKPVFISVDPARDSLKQLKHYAKGGFVSRFYLKCVDLIVLRAQISTRRLCS